MAKKTGRPSKFSSTVTAQAEKLIALGATDEQLADFFAVSTSTLSKWKLDHPEFSETLKKAKCQKDAQVERSLHERATGYSHKAVKIFLTKDGEVVEHEYVERYPPDPTSMIFWLKNRQKERWRDKQEHEVTGKNGGALTAVIVDGK